MRKKKGIRKIDQPLLCLIQQRIYKLKFTPCPHLRRLLLLPSLLLRVEVGAHAEELAIQFYIYFSYLWLFFLINWVFLHLWRISWVEAHIPFLLPESNIEALKPPILFPLTHLPLLVPL